MARGWVAAVLMAASLALACLVPAEGATDPGRKLLQTTAAPGGTCGAAVNARCRTTQCCSQWGYCGTTNTHCGTGCQALYSGASSQCASSGPTPPPPQPPVAPPPQPPVAPPPQPPTTPPSSCVDTYPACPGWGPQSCIFGGVPQLCPCMCSTGGTAPPEPPVAPPPQPPVAPPPQPPVVPPPQPPAGSGIASLIAAQQWEQIFPNRNNPACQGAASNFYNYNAFLTAAASYPAFASSSADPAVNKRELAAFLAQISHETTGGWPTAPGGQYAWGLCFTVEGGFTPQTAEYCAPSATFPCTPGKKYIGRGPMQLSWNYNYGPAGQAVGFDGLNNPEIVATDPVIAFKTALWFWMTPQSPKPSCHDVMAGRYTPTATDIAANRLPGYGLVTNIINGGLECGKGTVMDKEQSRIGHFERHAGLLGVTTGANLNCANQSSYV